MENLGQKLEIGEIRNFGSDGVCRAIFTLNVNRVAQKLRRIILLHWGLIFFYLSLSKNQKSHHLYDFRD